MFNYDMESQTVSSNYGAYLLKRLVETICAAASSIRHHVLRPENIQSDLQKLSHPVDVFLSTLSWGVVFG